jgi:hypothetical protein
VLEAPAVPPHNLDRELATLGPPPSPGSSARYARLQRLLEERPPRSVNDVMEIMRDHPTEPQSICLHADRAEGDEADAALFSMVVELEAGRMWVAHGYPCENAYREVDLSGIR